MKYTAEDIQVLTEIEHVLKKPTMWVGSIHNKKQSYWTYTKDGFKKFDSEINPAMHKIYREVLDNAIDELMLSKKKSAIIEVKLSDDLKTISIKDNGRGIPIEKHIKENKWVPELVLTQLRSGRNFSDNHGKTIGTFGVGVSLTNILSSNLKVVVQRNKKKYIQAFTKNSTKKTKPSIKYISSSESYTKIEFTPDQSIFNCSYSPELIRKELIDLAYMFSQITFVFYFNGQKERIKGKNFSEYLKSLDENCVCYEDDNCRMGLYLKTDEVPIDQISLVNGAFTTDGGTHIDYIHNWVVDKIRPTMEKKLKSTIRPSDIKNYIGVVCFMSMENPEFDSQTKSRLITNDVDLEKFMGFTNDKFEAKITRSNFFKGLLESVRSTVEAKERLKLRQEQKTLKRKRVEKLIDCNNTNRSKCTLFITEGESARGYLSAVSDRKYIASLPLKGKILNCFNANNKKVISNTEIMSIVNSCGLLIGDKGIDNIRYGRIAIATDVDPDGNAILSLLINFMYRYWPKLFEEDIVTRFVTPLYLYEKGNTKKYFYSKDEFHQWSNNNSDRSGSITYFKGLGSLSKNDWDYAVNKNPKYVIINSDEAAKENLKLAFGNDSNARKDWLS